MTPIPSAIARVLDRGDFCWVAARTERGPHLTPTVFAFSSGAVWVTTSRGSVKARAWRTDPAVAGLVRNGADAVMFTGRTRAYDLLDAGTWADVVTRGPVVTAASLRFSRKNARFFAGYAVDARRIPLAWTPPGRVFVELELEAAWLVRGDDVVASTGDEAEPTDEGALASRSAFRRTAGADAFVALPGRVRRALGVSGVGALAVEVDRRPFVVPARWVVEEEAMLAAVPAGALVRAGAPATCPAALAIDRPSWWRARRMLGCMVQGTADVFVPAQTRGGRRALEDALDRAGGTAERSALVRLRPRRVAWWEGWTSASTSVA